MSNDTGRAIYRAYHQAGADFLAYRLEKLFVRIETQDEIALHNDVLKEVLLIVHGEEKSFFESMSDAILYKPETAARRKRFLIKIACVIFNIGQKKG